MLNLALSSVFSQLLAWRDGYRFTCFAFRCRIRSPTTCICSTSSSVISTPANLASIASINSTRSRRSAPRSFVKCVSLVTNSRSTPSCFATRVQTSSMEKHSLNGSGVKLPMVMMKPPIRTYTPQRANQCARKCDSDFKILECGIGITAIWFRGRGSSNAPNQATSATLVSWS